MAVEYDISSDVAVIKETGSVSQCARVTQMYSGQITYDDEAGSKFATATINGKSQRVMLCIAVSGTVTYDDVPSLYSTVDGHRCLNIVTPTETGTPDDVPSLYETVVIDGQNVRAVRCIMINKTPVYDGVSSVCTFTGDDGKTHTAQLVNKVTGGSVEVIIKGTSPLNLPDAIANSLSYVKAFGGTEQNGTPTPDAPVDIVSNNGVLKYTPNLLDMAAENIVLGKYINNSGAVLDSGQNFYNSKYIPVVASGTYTWSTSSSVNYFSVMEYGSDYAFKKRTLFSNAGTSGSITLRSDTAFVLVGSNMDSTDVTLDKIAAVDWQFEKGSSATAYKPYSPTGIYTDGTVETINVHGKNLFDKNASYALFSGFLVNASVGQNTTLTAYNGGDKTIIIKVAPNTTYTVTRATNLGSIYDRIRCAAFTTLPVGTSQGVMLCKYINTTQASATFTTLSDTQYVAINVRNSGTVGDDWTQYVDAFQLELGSTATDYAPYFDGGTATAEMLLKIGDYQDEQQILSGVVTRNVGVKVFDGTEAWVANTVSSGRLVFYITKVSIGSNSTVLPNGSSNIKCSHFETSTAAAQSLYGTVWAGGTAINFTAGDFCANLAAWKQWLAAQYAAGTPVILVYPLATPTTESVAGQTLQVTDGDNVLEITQASLNNLELEAKYQAAVSLTIQEVEDANLDNNVEVTIS